MRVWDMKPICTRRWSIVRTHRYQACAALSGRQIINNRTVDSTKNANRKTVGVLQRDGVLVKDLARDLLSQIAIRKPLKEVTVKSPLV